MKSLFIIAGWHYDNIEFYNELYEIISNSSNIDVIISTHKAHDEIPIKTFNLIKEIPRCQVLFFDNKGYDWGMYSKAIDSIKDIVYEYDTLFFMHDDIEILNKNFPDIFNEYMKKYSLKLLGNCQNSGIYPFKLSSPEIIEWARLSDIQYEIKSDGWRTCRGSFFVIESQILKKIKKIPYKCGNNIRYGNWGLIVFAGMIADYFGNNSIGSISKKYLESDYIVEYERGKYQKKDITIKEKIRPLKINIGCGARSILGYLNIDTQEDSSADVLCDVKEVNFKNSTVDEVLMIHVLEHLNKFEGEKLLTKIYKWLKSDGKIVIESPDIVKVSKLIIKNRKKIQELEKGLHGLRGVYGEPFIEMGVGDYHKWGYSEYTLKCKLFEIGYKKVKIEKPLFHGKQIKRDLRVVGIK